MISNRASPYSVEHDIKRKPTSQFNIMFSFTIQKSSDFLIILYQIFRKRTIYMSSVADLGGAKAPCPQTLLFNFMQFLSKIFAHKNAFQ